MPFHPAPPTRPPGRWVFRQLFTGLLSLAGASVSFRLFLDHRAIRLGKGVSLAFCDAVRASGCRVAALSPFAEVGPGIPIASFAFGFFVWAFFMVFAAWRSFDGEGVRRGEGNVQSVAALASAFYIAVMIGFLEQTCPGCLTVHVIVFALLGTRVFAGERLLHDLKSKTEWRASIAHFLAIVAIALLTTGIDRWTTAPVDREFQIERESPAPIPPAEYTLTLGESGPEIAITLAIDLVCPYCKENLLNLSEALVAVRMRARVSILLFPMDQRCNPASGYSAPGSCSATMIAICRAGQKRFGEFLREAMLDQGKLLNDLDQAITLVEGDPGARAGLARCARSPETQARLSEHLKLASFPEKTAPVESVPTTWIGEWRITGRLRPAEWTKILRGKPL